MEMSSVSSWEGGHSPPGPPAPGANRSIVLCCFVNALNSVYDSVFNCILDFLSSGRKSSFTGHSLGAALASIWVAGFCPKKIPEFVLNMSLEFV